MDALHSIPLGLILFAAYAAGGVSVATVLHRSGHPSATAVSALVAWPVLLPLALGSTRPVMGSGPLASRILACLSALRGALDDPATSGLASDQDLAGLERTLLAADARIGHVDRILADSSSANPAVQQSADRLRAARDRSATEIEAVLSELEQLRLHAAMMVLSGDTDSLRDRVRGLLDRARALEEVTLM